MGWMSMWRRSCCSPFTLIAIIGFFSLRQRSVFRLWPKPQQGLGLAAQDHAGQRIVAMQRLQPVNGISRGFLIGAVDPLYRLVEPLPRLVGLTQSLVGHCQYQPVCGVGSPVPLD